MRRPTRRQERPLRATLSLGATLACLATTATAAQAATYTVSGTADTSSGSCQPGSCSLRQAVAAAGDGDTIMVPASATPYQVTNGPLAVTSALQIVGAGAGSTTLSGAGGSTRLMNIFNNSGPVTLENLTITGGQATNSGGGLAIAGPGGVLLRGVTVTGNTVSSTSSLFNAGGGGITSSAPLTLIDSTVSGNTVTVAASDGDSGGGGILMKQTFDNSDDLTLSDSNVTGNTATVTANGGGTTDANGGGGIYQDGGNLTINGSDIADNTATMPPAQTTNTGTPTDGGGGIFMFGNILALENSTVSGNSATAPGPYKSGGGGVLDSSNQSSYINDTITANTTTVPVDPDFSQEGGGGLMLNEVKEGALIANSTINANGAPGSSGGGINSQLTDATEVTDTIVTGNSAQAGEGNCSGPMLSFGHDLTDDPGASNTCSFTGPGDLLDTAPSLGALAMNGGPVPTEALQSGSPAIGAGDPAGCLDPLLGSMIGTDARGALRPAGGSCDIGAYQVALPSALTGAAYATAAGVVLTGTAANPDPRAATVTFQYGPTGAYGTVTAAQALPGSSGATAYTASLTGLSAGTYHFRLVATGADGSTDGSDGNFTVPQGSSAPTTTTQTPATHRPAKPAVTTLRPLRVGTRRVTLYGTVHPEAQRTTYHFLWGRSAARLTRRTRTRGLRAVNRGMAVTAGIVRLKPGTRYTVRLVAIGPGGVSIGAAVSFRTRRAPPHS